ncbi:MAG: TIR domain-containing protein [Alicyclobacillus sp.]|nr:TIR domain-containing protein [Alicyclobacillus sp.]
MARRVYFAFHYEDVKTFRANVVRNSRYFKDNEDTFIDASLWEKVKKEGDLAIKRMINKGLERTTVTAVLIGTHTFERPWVRYEIAKSFERGNGLLGVYIHKVRDKFERTASKGQNPFDYFAFRLVGDRVHVFERQPGLFGTWEACRAVPSVSKSQVRYDFRGLKEAPFSRIFRTYDWVSDGGYDNFAKWVEQAAALAGK